MQNDVVVCLPVNSCTDSYDDYLIIIFLMSKILLHKHVSQDMVIIFKAKAVTAHGSGLTFSSFFFFLAHVEETPELMFCLSFQNQDYSDFIFS